MSRLTVVTFLWRDPTGMWARVYRYGPDHVARMQSMLRRHLSVPHELVCVTDQPDALPAGVRPVPLDWATHRSGTRLAKLALWRPDAREVLGERVFYLDLDTVVVRDLAPVVDRPEDVVLWRQDPGKRSHYNTSLVLLSAGARPQVWERFAAGGYGGPSDQVFVSRVLGPDEATWGLDDGDGVFKARNLSNGTLPEDARLVTFNGPRDPSLPKTRQRCPWLTEHWT